MAALVVCIVKLYVNVEVGTNMFYISFLLNIKKRYKDYLNR